MLGARASIEVASRRWDDAARASTALSRRRITDAPFGARYRQAESPPDTQVGETGRDSFAVRFRLRIQLVDDV
ncbi:MAG TPA: hypothetical protein VFI46_16490, partial [Jiangellaceae bacterium]|nr:hypothetical protein [Jiangellaceae bacterium]